MADKETVIGEFERWCDEMADECPVICLHVLALLKEQEPIAPKLEQESMVCGVCGHDVIWQKMLGDNMWHDDYLNFCPHCGRAVKWDA